MKSTLIIEYDNVIYVPRPTSVSAGQARSVWLKGCLRREPHIAHPDMWEWLKERASEKILVETELGFEIRKKEND
jgi:hypothetical protein